MIAYLDCSTGISGDKFLGALIGAGFAVEALKEGLTPLGLADAVRVMERPSRGVVGIGLDVTNVPTERTRTWAGIQDLIGGSTIPERVRARSLAALGALAEAEASVHGVPVAEVHFHEIGAADTIVDVVGVALGLDALGIERVIASPVALGYGTVSTSHGLLPVPAPATALLLGGIPVVSGAIESELTTPTGAALIREFVSSFGEMPAMVVRSIGVGVGTRDIGAANVARILVGEAAGSDRPDGVEEIVVLQSNIDHVSPEHVAYAAQTLLDAGALDVWQTPIVMKKGRAAVSLSVLATPGTAPALASLMIAETGTLGVRVDPTERFVTPREARTIATSLGDVRFKLWTDERGEHLRAEHDDVARIARERALPIGEVTETLEADARALLGL
ncbi:MAG: nickel pincer cofactor biosynthesis protein LarC [Coriobacteriia bacterium]